MEIIKLTHQKNFRDLGGITLANGKTLKKGMLIRGTTLRKLKNFDIKLLKEKYKLKTIVDLRTKKEADERSDDKIEGVSYHHFPILSEAVVGISHEKKAHSLKSLWLMPKMEDLYKNMVKGESQENLVKVLKFVLPLPPDQYSVAFHCTAGKDRTGILAALLLTFLGANRREIIEDYLYTNKTTKKKAFFVYIALLVGQFNPKLAKKIRMYYIAKKDYIESALDSLVAEYGSLENFFDKKLQLSPEEKAAIIEKFSA